MSSAEDRLTAAVALVGHTGAQHLEYGYLHDGVPTEAAGWWATAQYRGAKVTVEDQPGPLAAVEALAQRLLTGARCKWCEGLVAMSPDGAIAHAGSLLADGSRMPETVEEIQALGQCLWRLNVARSEPGCLHGQSTAPAAPRDRAARRRLRREYESTRPGASR